MIGRSLIGCEGRAPNHVALQGHVVERQILRYTPGGVPVVDLVIQHQSVKVEAEGQRDIAFTLAARAAGACGLRLNQALGNAPSGCLIQWNGFLAAKRKDSHRLVLIVESFEFIEVRN